MILERPEINLIRNAWRFIETELTNDRTPSLDQIATAAGLSKFHFHRVYKLLTGESCQETILRAKLSKGLSALEIDETTITQAAFMAGYSSSQAFAKAIKRELSSSASDIRSDPDKLATTIRSLTQPEPGAATLHVELGTLDPLRVSIVRTVDKYPDLADTYNTLFAEAGGPQYVQAALGLLHRDIETSTEAGFIFDVALLLDETANISSDVSDETHLWSGDYLIARHTGLDADIPNTLNVLYATVLLSPALQLADTPCIHHYIDDPEDVDEASCRTDIYLPIFQP